jgi:hypothetical protein
VGVFLAHLASFGVEALPFGVARPVFSTYLDGGEGNPLMSLEMFRLWVLS